MCGFAGELALGPESRTDCRRARPMLEAILHRGPDSCGAWQDPERRAALLHCRLAVVDIEHGQQPMHDTHGRATIVYNGEIYGFKRLRRELQAGGYEFLTNSDTEVLLALYLRDGPDFVGQLEGEFAFVIYDHTKRLAILSRDRFGVKPLLLSKRNGLLLFGSEAKAILAHPFSERALSLEALHRRMHGVMFPEETVFQDIHAVAPGTTMLIDGAGAETILRHADLDPQAAGSLALDEGAALDAFEEAFSAAVKDRLHGDVPIGVFLSAGVDSNTVATTMREVSDNTHPAFTIGFQSAGYAESEEAAATAKHLGFEHHIEHIETGGLDSHFARSIWHGETIAVNGHGAAKMLLARNASSKVKVTLGGEGADEFHGGWAYFRHAALLEAAKGPRGWWEILKFLARHGARDGVMTRATPILRKRLSGPKALGVPYAAIRASHLRYFLSYVLQGEFQRKGQPDPDVQVLDWLDRRAPGARQLDDVTLSRFTAALTDMPVYNLSYLGDRAEMVSGLEGRLPFLDKRVVDLLWGLPGEFHMNATTNKTLIRRVLRKRLPQTAERSKRVFLAPSSASKGVLEGPFSDRWLSAEMIETCGFFRPKAVRILRSAYSALPEPSGARAVLESFLTLAISAHLLNHMFVTDFSGSLERYRVAPPAVPIPGLDETA